MNHVLLTRFNLPSAGLQTLIRAQDGWLRQRVDLFEKYCVPSVKYQSEKDFTWLVYFDPESPQWLREMAENYQSAGILVPVFRETVSSQDIFSDIRKAVANQAEDVLTTNLDNDDALAVDFVSRVGAASVSSRTTAIYVSRGLVRQGNRVYAYTFPRNAFNSVRTSWAAPSQTCWSEWHTDFDKLMPVVELCGPPGWMQIVHGSNVSNRVRGRLISPTTVSQQFGPLVADVPQPRMLEILNDSAIKGPLRLGFETARAAGKRFIVITLGRDGLDRVRAAWRSRSAPLKSRLGRRAICGHPENEIH